MLLRRVIGLAFIWVSAALGQKATLDSAVSAVVGTVTDHSRAPLKDAEVRLVVSGSMVNAVRTGDDGRFLVAGDVRGPSKLQVRRVGFSAREIELVFPRDTMGVLIIVLDPAAPQLAGRDAGDDEEHASGWLGEFYQRRRSHSIGIYFTRQEILSKQARHLSDVLRGVPGVTLSASERGGFAIRMRNCRYAPVLWMNGSRVAHTELDEVARLDDIAAMEVYLTNAGVPPDFLDRSNLGCGTILVWTRQ